MLFLDEPLSGLDSYAAYTLVVALQLGVLLLESAQEMGAAFRPFSSLNPMPVFPSKVFDGYFGRNGVPEEMGSPFSPWLPMPPQRFPPKVF